MDGTAHNKREVRRQVRAHKRKQRHHEESEMIELNHKKNRKPTRDQFLIDRKGTDEGDTIAT